MVEYTRYLSSCSCSSRKCSNGNMASVRSGYLTNGVYISHQSQYIVVSLTTGSASFLMWLGEQVTEKGVGNGISIILVIQHCFSYAGGYDEPYSRSSYTGASNVTNGIIGC